MFYFFSTEQRPENASYHRGVLFEKLLRRFLEKSGYTVDINRRKQSSLEYDIHGVHSIDFRGVVGEAKAHADTIGGQDVAAFVGKAVPFFHKSEPYSGLFLSTSSLSPEAEDFLRNLTLSAPYRLTHICGAELEQRIREKLNLPSSDRVDAIVRSLVPFHSGQHLLQTDRGTFIVVLGSAEESAFDDRFALIGENGNLVNDGAFLKLIQRSIPAFQELDAVTEKPSERLPIEPHRRDVPKGLITASDWFDYRRPAGPTFFVGRSEPIDKTRRAIAEAEGGVVIEIKSRSGVGKSSVLAVLENIFRELGHIVELHDARDVHSASDVLSLFQRFTGETRRLDALEDIPTALSTLRASEGQKGAVFMVDQFESTFTSPEVFYAYEYVALCIARSTSPGIAMVFARKDDLLTTHDEIQVSLERLRSLSLPISLEDFSREEARELLLQIAHADRKRLSPNILAQVLEFAQGFPWLLKRTMSHVVAMIASGAHQQELLSSGLHLEDLFEEELSELDEHERGYLTRLAAVLPATYQSLARRFDDDPFLRAMLEKLTARRLLRFSAGTYDTYNDVFKDFLLYERLPERAHAQMFRTGLVPVIHAFRSLSGQNRIDPEAFGKTIGRSLGGTYNILRELRLAGLVSRTAAGWSVPDVVREYEHQGRLGEYVRQSVLRSRSVSEFLVRVDQSNGMSRQEIAEFLKDRFPFVEAKPAVWETYVRVFLDWMVRLKLTEISRGDICNLVREPKEATFAKLGNLRSFSGFSQKRHGAFIPMRDWSVLTRVLKKASESPLRTADLPATEANAKIELIRLGAVEQGTDGRLRPILSVEELEGRVRELFKSEPYTSFWKNVREGLGWEASLSNDFGLSHLAPGSQTYFAKKLASWGKKFGFLAANQVITHKKTAQKDLFPE